MRRCELERALQGYSIGYSAGSHEYTLKVDILAQGPWRREWNAFDAVQEGSGEGGCAPVLRGASSAEADSNDAFAGASACPRAPSLFATATAWYSAQASMVTRRQFALHADMLDAGALSQRCLSTMQRARSALVRSARHAPADLAALSSDLAALVAHAEHLERGLRRVDESLEVHRANLQDNLHSASPVRGP